MFRYFVVCALVASALADVSHLFPKPRYSFPNPKPFRVVQLAKPVVVPVKPSYTSPPFIPPVPVTVTGGRQIAILRQDQNIEPEGGYSYSYETENGIGAQETAQVRILGQDQVEKSAQGSYTYTAPDGQVISVTYVADGNGFQPQGSHLPVAPEIPAAILRSLEYNAAHPEPAVETKYVRL